MVDVILSFFQFISNLGPSVMMPIIMLILGLALGAPFGKSLRAGLTVGVGFIGLGLVTGLLGGSLGPAVQEMVARYGLKLDAVDIGWVASAAIAFASQVGTFIIPIGITINVVMLLTKTTQTINVDIWDYWHFAFTGAIVQSYTGSIWMGIAAAALNMVIIMILGDWTAPGLEKYNGLPGISLPHGFTTAFVPFAYLFCGIIDKIPGLSNVKVDMEKIQRRLGVFGEPILIGLVFGIVIGIIAGYDVFGVTTLGMSLAACLVLIPKMAALLMEGLIPVSDAAQVFIEKRIKGGGKIYIGLDSAVGIGHPICMTSALILVPVSILLAVLLPGNRVLPFADLAVIPWMFVLFIPAAKGDFMRSLVSGFFTLIIMLYMGTDMVDTFVKAAVAADPASYAAAGNFSSLCDGSNPMTWAFFRMSGLGWLGIGVIAAIGVAMAVYNRKKIIKEANEMASADIAA
ncbi:PTS galactitol transporter subunit IIC [Alkalibacter rhizosphaerae]|uniref:PTS galactitol transporter subunit IIC n=1 Tax=Alkalibacter rhizosphaerae TaxID=2815577 RepID=UPI001FEE8F14|nr:PTS transporter subunit IIC [Alkalibacter rhizosphaerae]